MYSGMLSTFFEYDYHEIFAIHSNGVNKALKGETTC